MMHAPGAMPSAREELGPGSRVMSTPSGSHLLPQESSEEASAAAAVDPDTLRRSRVIHFDLKPANILLTKERVVKITDFGLSKIMENSKPLEKGTDSGSDSGSSSGTSRGAGGKKGKGSIKMASADMSDIDETMSASAIAMSQHHASEMSSMELTSPGAGTYWYLPPECFRFGGPTPPRISDKVDVWSLGVIFFQMIYGKRPFGEGLTQEQIYRDKVIVNAGSVEFPSKPAISSEALAFIRRCLEPDQAKRPSVRELSRDPYLRKKLSGK